MTTTPKIWKSLTQVNATDSGPNGDGQLDGQIAALKDGGYVVIWGDNSGVYNPSGTALVAQRYNSAGNKVGGEVNLGNGFPGSASSPDVTSCPMATSRSHSSAICSTSASKIPSCVSSALSSP